MQRRQFLGALAATACPTALSVGSAAGADTVVDGAAPTELLLRDAMVITMDAQRRAFESGYVWLKGESIHRVGPTSELSALPSDLAVRSLPDRLIMPGLVNCHTHLSNGILRGLYDEMPLEVWFSRGMWPVLEALDGDAARAGAELALLELLESGVTTLAGGDFGTPNADVLDGVLEAVHAAGVRAIVSRITVDSDDEESPSQAIPAAYRETPERAGDEVRRLQARYGSPRVTVAPEALGVLRCTPAMVQAMHAVAVETGAPLLMHAASSPEERAEAERRFGHGSISELERLGVLGPRTLLAHAIWLDDAEIAVLAGRETGLSHNPVANAYYAAGIARLAELLEAGVRVGLGTDGATTNNGQNLWETMKMALLFQKQRLNSAGFGSAELMLELATRGGASALHLDGATGALAPGLQADLLVIDPRTAALSPPQTLVSNLVYSNDRRAVQEVYVAGRQLVSEGRHRWLDRDAILARARRAAARVLRQADLDGYLRERSRWSWRWAP
jgi:5-methylthioadenosine/S-adenosylhomocysteine deaminase